MLHLNCLGRTFFGTKATSDTTVFHPKMRGTSCTMIEWLCNTFCQKRRHMGCHVLIDKSLFNFLYCIIDLNLCMFGECCNFFRCRQIKNRSPGICHFYSIKSIYFSVVYCFACHVIGSTRCCSIGGEKEKVTCFQSCFFKKFFYNARGCLKNSDVWKNAQKLLYVRRESAGRLSPDKDFRRHRQ